MSGPKVTIYTIKDRLRDLFREQLSCDAMCKEINRKLEEIKNMSKMFEDSDDRKELVESLNCLESVTNNKFREIQKKLNEHLVQTDSIKKNFQSVNRKLNEIRNIKTELYKLEGKIIEDSNRIIEYHKNENRKKIINYLNQNNDEDNEKNELTKEKITISDAFSELINAGNNISSSNDIKFNKFKNKIKSELENIKLQNMSKEIDNRIKNALLEIQRITTIPNLKNFYSVTCKKIFNEYDNYKKEFDDLICKYQTLSNMINIKSKNVGDFIDKTQIEDEINKINEIILKQREQEYIATCVDEVMRDMGYDLLGNRDITKKNGNHFKQELYKFDEKTAINITYSSNGQITMELGGVANEDRIPTNEEKEELIEGMECFCNKFPEFEERMAELGIIVNNRIRLTPISKEYATIINIDDYKGSLENDSIVGMGIPSEKFGGKQGKLNYRSNE